MDDRRFDQLVKAAASGASRRSLLKGMLGLGGAVVGSAEIDHDVDAARRPTPTPKPVKCPGTQSWNGSACVCVSPPAPETHKCGPDCCTGVPGDAPSPTHSECCDNNCCYGTCYGEELCCPTNPGGAQGQVPPLAELCSATDECCHTPDFCCTIDGCCSTLCWGGNSNDDFCCPAEDLCPGDGTSPEYCCTGDSICCGGGTDANSCIDLSVDGACCTVVDCGPPTEGTCGWECSDGQCVSVSCLEGSICCQGGCVSSSLYSACPVDPEECCSTSGGFICCGTSGCCLSTHCNEINGDCCASEAAVCRVQGGCCEPPQECCLGETCCDPDKCAAAEGCCTGDEIVCGDACCAAGQCNDRPFCCPANRTACGTDCCDDLTETCSDQGICECAVGFVLCDDVCTAGECCGSDTTACASLGYDPECVLCNNGTCTDSGTEFVPCSTIDVDQGWCNNGHCVGCFAIEDSCEQSSQCCSNNCVQGTCQLD